VPVAAQPKRKGSIMLHPSPPVDDRMILDGVERVKREFGVKCNKYAGAITVQTLRRALQERGFSVSERDVFIRGIPVEIDLLIPTPLAEPQNGILYEPSQVSVVFEVKNYGSFGAPTVETVRRSFSRIRGANDQIACLYVTLSEREGYIHAVKPEPPGFDAFTLFWHTGSWEARIHTSSGDWERLLAKLEPLKPVDGAIPPV